MHRKPRHTLLALLIVLMGILNVHIGRTQDGFSVTPQWSFDGERVALVEGMSILIYEVESGAILHRLDSHTDAILSIDWSPVDDRLASAGADQTVKVWDINNGSLLFTLSGHQAPVSALVWSPDGTEILSWGFDTQPNLFVWDASTGALLARHNSGSIVAAAFSADEKKLALSTSLLISIRTSQILEPIIQSPRVMCCANQMYSLAWSSDSTKIATGSINGLITIWDAETLTPLRRFPANPHYVEDSRDVPDLALSWVRDVSFAVDGSVQAVSGDGTVRQWDTQGNLLQEAQIGQFETAAWSPYSTRLAVQISADSSNLTSADVLRIETPFASLQPIDSLDALPDFVEQVESLPEGAIPAACRADLLAVADALMTTIDSLS